MSEFYCGIDLDILIMCNRKLFEFTSSTAGGSYNTNGMTWLALPCFWKQFNMKDNKDIQYHIFHRIGSFFKFLFSLQGEGAYFKP